jgi:hypothetical protein
MKTLLLVTWIALSTASSGQRSQIDSYQVAFNSEKACTAAADALVNDARRVWGALSNMSSVHVSAVCALQ